MYFLYSVVLGAGLLLSAVPARAQLFHHDHTDACLHGTLVDFTRNSGCDHRMYAPSLCEYRDMYVYLPPGYDRSRQYPP